ncbi:CsbD family protein [Terrihabitans sp. B22-R8]|uniref:CsbD family protein n=1 Tax=Terrihabitans sp. B22-R8 TaxID=3425128 RepID=UPI00403D0A2E
MQWQMVAGRWNEFKGNAKETWDKLTDDDLRIAEDHREELIGKLQGLYGHSREEAEHEVDAWSHRLHVRYEEPGPEPILYPATH